MRSAVRPAGDEGWPKDELILDLDRGGISSGQRLPGGLMFNLPLWCLFGLFQRQVMSTARYAAHTGGTPPHKTKASGPTSSSFVPRFLLKESIVAGPNYNRWLFPPAALLVHFSIGQAYAYR